MKPSTFASWRPTGSAPCSNRGTSTSSLPIRLAREVCDGSRRRFATDRRPTTRPKRLNVFERYLSLWVGLCMVVGVVLGLTAPD